MSTTIARFQNGKIYTIQDEAFVQHNHSGVIHVAGTVGDKFAIAAHSNIGNSAVFAGTFIDRATFDAAVEEIEGASRHWVLDAIVNGEAL